MEAKTYRELIPPNRILLGPGPSNVDPRVLKAMSSPLVGHLDPYFLELMDETMELLRYVFKTKNRLCIPISGTGSAGMEAAVCNVVQRGDEVIVGVNGLFGERMSDVVNRCGGKSVEVKEEWGRVISKEAVEKALSESNAKVVGIVQAETSTGVLQPLKEISKLAKEYGALLLVDTVTSLGGCELDVEELGIDICYSGTQKCLNCPPGLAPITFNEKAMDLVRNRETKVQSWYLDLSLLEKYWSEGRVYHHTAPVSMIYGLREALRMILEEGLEKRWERHKRNSLALISGVEAMGLKMHPQEHRLPSLNSIAIPNGVPDLDVRKILLNDFNIEIGGGLGVLKGKIWRVGLMGLNSNETNVMLFLDALGRILKSKGHPFDPIKGIEAAIKFYSG
jgi:alanine-glyoxylate transaminase/serine-glyoxylate transaminase/serine-pyruvate transaminase